MNIVTYMAVTNVIRHEVLFLPTAEGMDSNRWQQCQRSLILAQLESTTLQLQIAKNYQERMMTILERL